MESENKPLKKIEKLLIIGSGPASWTSAIYAVRADLDPLVYEGLPSQTMIPGGQLMYTTEVENFPGFPNGIQGPDLMDAMKEQAKRFGVRSEMKEIRRVNFGTESPFSLEDNEGKVLQAHSVVIATGARANWLGQENEQRLARTGGGVSACAVCDGALPIFRDKELAVVGGGDSAMEESMYLSKFASKVHILHRRDQFRASKTMQNRVLENPKIQVHWNRVVEEVIGKNIITSLRIKNTQTQEKDILPIGGLFLALGHSPNTDFLKDQLELDPQGYIVLKKPFRMETSVEGVFGAGDVVDPYYRQAVTSAGTGCMAALDAERWLSKKSIE